MTHDEAYAAARKALHHRRGDEASIRELFDAGVKAERERCALMCEVYAQAHANICAAAIRKEPT